MKFQRQAKRSCLTGTVVVVLKHQPPKSLEIFILELHVHVSITLIYFHLLAPVYMQNSNVVCPIVWVNPLSARFRVAHFLNSDLITFCTEFLCPPVWMPCMYDHRVPVNLTILVCTDLSLWLQGTSESMIIHTSLWLVTILTVCSRMAAVYQWKKNWSLHCTCTCSLFVCIESCGLHALFLPILSGTAKQNRNTVQP
jgi:hypothetical protein